MKQVELVSTLRNATIAALASSAYTTPEGDPIPVRTWNEGNDVEPPVVLVQDHEGHRKLNLGNSPYSGLETDEFGNFSGERFVYGYNGRPSLVVRHDHETSAYMVAHEIQQFFYDFERRPGDLMAHAPSGLVLTEPHILKVEVGPAEYFGIDYRVANAVTQRAVRLTVDYLDYRVHEASDPLDDIYTEWDADNDGTTDTSAHVDSDGADPIT